MGCLHVSTTCPTRGLVPSLGAELGHPHSSPWPQTWHLRLKNSELQVAPHSCRTRWNTVTYCYVPVLGQHVLCGLVSIPSTAWLAGTVMTAILQMGNEGPEKGSSLPRPRSLWGGPTCRVEPGGQVPACGMPGACADCEFKFEDALNCLPQQQHYLLPPAVHGDFSFSAASPPACLSVPPRVRWHLTVALPCVSLSTNAEHIRLSY